MDNISDRNLDYFLGYIDEYIASYDTDKPTVERAKAALYNNRHRARLLLRNIARTSTKLADQLDGE